MNTKTEQIYQLSAPFSNPFQGSTPRVLFVCSAGLLRSATAATIGSKYFNLNTRNCGTSSYALVPLSINLILWAHKIFFVNEENFEAARFDFEHHLDSGVLENKSVVWDIVDDYDYMNPKLQDHIIEELMYHYEYIRT